MPVTNRNAPAASTAKTATAGPAPRATYRHGDLRRALLDAGVELARQGGPDAVVLREATRRAGVAPNAAYRHFANRDDLLAAVRAAVLWRQLGGSYWDFLLSRKAMVEAVDRQLA